jgi:hypothetical protein
VATLADAEAQIRRLFPQPLPEKEQQAPLERSPPGMEVEKL